MITISETTARTVRALMEAKVDAARNFDEYWERNSAKSILDLVLSDNYEALREIEAIYTNGKGD